MRRKYRVTSGFGGPGGLIWFVEERRWLRWSIVSTWIYKANAEAHAELLRQGR